MRLQKRTSLFVLLIVGVCLTQFYQNCAPLTPGFTVMASSSDTPLGSLGDPHPQVDHQTDLPARRQLVVPRTYVAQLFREVFTSTTYPVASLENLIDKWVMYKGGQFGGACNIYSSYSSRDCAGTVANTNIPAYTDDNTMRESFRVQLCENILGQDNGVKSALEKISLTTASPISATTVTAAYGLFYRNDPPADGVVGALLDLSQSLAPNTTAVNKWRLVLDQICESPDWQLL